MPSELLKLAGWKWFDFFFCPSSLCGRHQNTVKVRWIGCHHGGVRVYICRWALASAFRCNCLCRSPLDGTRCINRLKWCGGEPSSSIMTVLPNVFELQWCVVVVARFELPKCCAKPRTVCIDFTLNAHLWSPFSFCVRRLYMSPHGLCALCAHHHLIWLSVRVFCRVVRVCGLHAWDLFIAVNRI